jgi:hypothetical protein
MSAPSLTAPTANGEHCRNFSNTLILSNCGVFSRFNTQLFIGAGQFGKLSCRCHGVGHDAADQEAILQPAILQPALQVPKAVERRRFGRAGVVLRWRSRHLCLRDGL